MSLATIVLISALGGSPALQSEAPRIETRSEVRIVTSGGPGTGSLDADNDGVVTREEFSAPMTTAFDRLDADHDGRLTTEELAAGQGEGGHGGPEGPGPQVMILREGPGGPEGGPMMFHGGPEGAGPQVMILRDGPGGPEGGPMMFHGGGEGGAQVFMFRHGGPEGGPPPGPGGPGQRRVEIRRFAGPEGPGQLDTDNDGKVSEAEFLAPMREAFKSMDADSDGSLDESEEPHGPPPPPPAH